MSPFASDDLVLYRFPKPVHVYNEESSITTNILDDMLKNWNKWALNRTEEYRQYCDNLL